MNAAVERHESELANAVGVQHAVTFAFARQALAAILEAAGLESGDAVVLPPLTCKVVPLALLSLNLRPVYADVDRATLNMESGALERAAQEAGVRAILFQHTYGQGAGLEAAERIARERELFLLEDCAQCLPVRAAAVSAGGAVPPRRAAIFSNNVMKPMPAGSGGVAVTADDALAARIRGVRDGLRRPSLLEAFMLGVERNLHGLLLRPSTYWALYAVAKRFGSHYEHRSADDEVRREIREQPGWIAPSQARVGSRWLARVESHAAHRRAVCAAYAEALSGTPAVELPCGDADLPLCYFPILVPAKHELLEHARKARVEMVPWPIRTPIYPVEDERELATYGYRSGSCPVAEDVAGSLVGLPTHERIRAREREAIVQLVGQHCGGR